MKLQIADVADLEAPVNKYKWQNYTEEELKSLAINSSSLKNFCEKLGYTAYRSIIKKQIIKEYPDLEQIFTYLSHGGEDLNSLTFNSLRVLSFNPDATKQQGHRCWNCECKCGRKIIVRGTRLKNGEVKSCLNCANREDLSGKRFGKLILLEIDEQKTSEQSDRRAVWKCLCDCGNLYFTTAHSLKENHLLSCGCDSMSKGEQLLEKIFRDNQIKYRCQYSFTDLKKIRLLKFDFAIFDNKDTLKYIIEYQGQQHYEPVKYFGGKDSFVKQQEYDEEKRKYCKENNIQLIEIPYWDFAKINLDYLKEKMGVYYGKIKN